MTTGSSTLVGRHDELGVLEAALGSAASGVPVTVLVGGSAGIGKSHLIDTFLRRRGDVGEAVLLTGRCAPGVEIAFAPLFGALRQLSASVGQDAADALLAEVPALAAAVGLRGVRGSASLEAVAIERVYGDALHLLGAIGAISSGAPCVLVVEDLHWADAETIALLSFLSRSLTVERCLVVGTYRDEELRRGHRLHTVVTAAKREPRASVIELEPLTPEELVTLAREAGYSIDITEASRLATRSGGNPFFAHELLLAGDPDRLPEAVEDLLRSQLDGLPGAVHRLLAVVSTAGPAATVELVRCVADLPDETLHDALRAASETRFVSMADDGQLAFRHDLLAEAVACTLLPTERRELHHRIARELTARPDHVSGGHAAHLAYHWSRAGEPDAALTHALAAADDAAARQAPAAVLEQLTTVLDLWDSAGDPQALAGIDRFTVEVRASEAASFADERDLAVALAQAAVDHAGDDPERRADALGRLAYALYSGGHMADAHDVAAQAVAAVDGRPPSRSAAEALFFWSGTALTLGRFEDVVERAGQIRSVVETVDDPELQSRCDHTEGTARAAAGEIGAGITLLRRAIDERITAGRASAAAGSIYNLGEVLRAAGPLDAALAEIETDLARVRGLGVHDPFLLVQSSLAELLLRLGRLRELDALLEPVPAQAPFLAAYGFSVVRAGLALERGRHEEARLWLSSTDVATARAFPMGAPRVAAAEAALLLADGEPERAYDLARSAADVSGPAARRQEGNRLLALAARAAATSPSPPGIARLVDESAAVIEDLEAKGAEPVAQRAWHAVTVALAGGDLDPPAAWEAAVDALGAAGMRLEEARARVDWAAALARAADRDRAAAELATAEAVASDQEATALLRAVDDLRRRARLRDPGDPREPGQRFGLTGRELEVVQLVAEGMTNREIGERLFISEKTASVHLSNAMRKLGVTDRRAAARAARDAGLV